MMEIEGQHLMGKKWCLVIIKERGLRKIWSAPSPLQGWCRSSLVIKRGEMERGKEGDYLG